MSHPPLQCRLIVFASTSRFHAMSFRRHIESELSRHQETRGVAVSIEARLDGKGVVFANISSQCGGAALLRVLNLIDAAMHELLNMFPEWQTSQVQVTADGVKSYRMKPAQLRKQSRALSRR